MVWGTILVGRHGGAIMTVPTISNSGWLPTRQGRFVFCSDGNSTRTRFVFFSDGNRQNDAIRGFKATEHSIRRGDLDLGSFLARKVGQLALSLFLIVFGV